MASNADAPAATGSVSFKAYYTPNGGDKPQEVRRFGMEQTEVTSFDLLKKKIREVFPSLTKVEFTVGWKDFDNDDIIISSDEELLTALTESTGQVHRLYLVSKYTSPPPTFHSPLGWKQFNAVVTGCPAVDPVDVIDSDEEDDDMILTPPGCKRSWQSISQSACKKVHPRIYCDGCNKNIDSHRYKCLECDDFDLCHHCESQLMHEEHIMIRIPLTKNYYTKLNNFTKSMRSMSDTLHKIDNRCKKQERRIQKVREMNKRCDDTFGVAEEMLHCSKRCKRDEKVKEKKEKRDKKEKGQPRIHSSFSQVPAGSNGSANDNTSSQSKASTSKDPTGQSSGGDCPFPTGFLKSLFDHQVIGSLMNPQNFMTLQNFLQQLSPVPDHVLQEIAKNLADVTLSNPDTPSASSTPVGNPFSMNKEGAASVDTDSAPQPTFSAPPATGKPEDSQVSVQAISVAPSDLAAPSLAATTDNSHVPESPHNQQLCFSSSSEEVDVEEWTVVDDQAKEERSNHASVYPKLPESESIPELNIPAPVLHQDPAVRKCLQSLADMGYQAQDHLIVELAEEFKGNLDHVLNVLLT